MVLSVCTKENVELINLIKEVFCNDGGEMNEAYEKNVQWEMSLSVL